MIDWSDLQFFLAVQRSQTLAGAARALKVEHTTVGRRLVALEDALRAKLFVRTPDGFRTTRMGNELLPLAEQAEALFLQMERIALADDDRAEGNVRITTSESFASLLGRWLAGLRAQHPRITVEVLSGNARLDLMRREADIAVRFAPTSEGVLVCRKIAAMGWAPYASSSYVAERGEVPASGALAGHDVIGFSESLSRVPGALWIAENGEGANVVMKSGSLPAACQAAVSGLGIAVLPCFMADAQPSLVRLPPGIVGTRDGYLIVHPDLARVARVRVVLAFLVECFRNAAATLSHGAAARPVEPPAPRGARKAPARGAERGKSAGRPRRRRS